jgi:glycosyltransferase involved in cell wall biosynthesis
MNLLIINQHSSDVIGGSEIQCDLIATWLTRFGHRVQYFAVKATSIYYEKEYDVIPQSGNFFYSLYKVLRKRKPELVYWRYNKKHLLLSVILCRFFGCKIIFSISTFSDIQPWIWTGIHPLEGFINFRKQAKSRREILRSFKLLFYPLKSYINYLGFYLIEGVVGIQKKLTNVLPVNQQITIYNSMDTNTTGGFYWNKPYVVWVANIKSKKNPESYIELARRLKDEDVDFLMIGQIQQSHYQVLLEEVNLPSNLHYLGFKTPADVNNIIRSSLFLIHTCNPEGFGNNFIQAWFQGKPTLTLYFDPDDIIKEFKLGYHSGSLDKLVEDTKILLHDNSLRKEIGDRAENFARCHFVPEQNAKKYEAFFQKILNGI